MDTHTDLALCDTHGLETVISETESPESSHGSSINLEKTSGVLQNGNSQKTCRVCGDTALNMNFGAVSCESCKAFFRRNALKKKVSLIAAS
jgi:ribosomal protein L37AE/L43A